nr:arrestin domain-containing protein 17-like isoform X1 [Leptinotarsa decemlineata]XP_023014657.1 arrestin domain-containing protein 17-like isoform X1 [Leptinotarsa decemlineata]
MEIVLSNSQEIYFAGNKVFGHVLLTFQMETHVKGITLEVRGLESACFAARRRYYDSTENKMIYRARNCMGGTRYNTFLEVDLPLSRRKDFNIGRYELPFSFPLAKDLPTSYQGKYGYVTYYLKAKMDVVDAPDLEEKVDFEVHSFIDFNEFISDLQMKHFSYQNEKMVGSCCCPGGSISIDLRMEKIAFVQGEMAKVQVDLTNFSNERVEKIVIKLTRTIKSRLELRQRDFFRYQHDVLSSNFDIGVEAREQRTYEFDLEIPRSEVLYNFKRCVFLCQWFTLSVEAILPGNNKNIIVETKVEIGHIPLGGLNETQQRTRQESSRPDLRESPTMRSGSPPPTYGDAVINFPGDSARKSRRQYHTPSAPLQLT